MTYQALIEKAKQLNELEKKYIKASDARFNCPAGSSRAKVTTLNARLNTYAEAKQNCLDELKQMVSVL